ncbi:MAG TPA: outer membrane beta-barrel protein [Hyphomicrobiales bacterium]|nr:outer membrane beta-barrel protein [Rhodobiaceae bacterium]HXK54280.1 outer membrane beta-barrel protein [Hyphomicrobiales bacterium]
MSFPLRSTRRLITVLAAATSFLCSGLTAGAQAPISEAENEADAAGRGIRAGSFLVFPALELRAGYSDNINLSSTNPVGGKIVDVAPELRWTSDWSRHELSGAASGVLSYPGGGSSANEGSAAASTAARIDISSQMTLRGNIGYELDFEPGRRDHVYRASSALRYGFNRLSLELRGGIDVFDYSANRAGAVSVSEVSVDDYRQNSLALRAAYEVSPLTGLFAEAGLNRRDFRQKVDASGFGRGSHGVWGALGISRSNGSALQGELALTYRVQRPDDARLAQVAGLGVDALLTWQASALTRLTLAAATDIGETTLAGASGYRRQTASIALDHSLGRRAAINGKLSYERNDFDGVAIEEQTLEAALGVEYFVSRAAVLTADFSHLRFDTTQPNADYRENRFTLGLRLER